MNSSFGKRRTRNGYCLPQIWSPQYGMELNFNSDSSDMLVYRVPTIDLPHSQEHLGLMECCLAGHFEALFCYPIIHSSLMTIVASI